MPQKASKKSSGATEVSPCVSVCLAAGRVLKKIEFISIIHDDNVYVIIGTSSRELTTRKMIETLMVVLIFESWLDWQPWSGEPHLIEKTCFRLFFYIEGKYRRCSLSPRPFLKLSAWLELNLWQRGKLHFKRTCLSRLLPLETKMKGRKVYTTYVCDKNQMKLDHLFKLIDE